MAPIRVLHVAMECVPYSKVGGMADVVGALPGALAGLGIECTPFTPWYPQIYRKDPGEEIASFDVWIAETPHRVRLRRTEEGAILVDQPSAFDRPGVYDDPRTGEGFRDGLFRCVLLQQAARIALREGFIATDVVHCHDNHAGLLPVYLKDDGGPPSILTIHNLAYQGIYSRRDFPVTGLHSDRFYGHSAFEYYGDLSLMKAGLSFADLVTTVSPGYAAEIVEPDHGHGLDGVLRGLGSRLLGILNGIDTDLWDPAKDAALPATFSAARPAGKKECTRVLRERAGLKADPSAPLCGMVSRVTSQKGLDLVGAILPWLVRRGAQVLLLGSGDPAILDLFRGATGRWPGQVALLEGYDEALSHLVYAGSDIFLMPSRFEPCGLSQMYAMRYGAVPVVTKVGGLRDTVTPFDDDHLDGVGVLADWPSPESVQGAVNYALELFATPERWKRIRRNALKCDFSWGTSAMAYRDVYTRVLKA